MRHVRPFAPADTGGLFLVHRAQPDGVPRMASFRVNCPHVARADSGVAVFDAMLPGPRAIVLPALPPGHQLDWHALRARLTATDVRRCPSCGWSDIRRSVVRNAADYLLSLVGLVPFRCRSCGDRFHVGRRSLRAVASQIYRRYL